VHITWANVPQQQTTQQKQKVVRISIYNKKWGAYPFIQYVKTGKGNTFFNNFYVSGDLDFLLFEGYTLKLTFADYFH